MIRLIQRRLIIPRGDTGSFQIPLLETAQAGDTAVFSIYDPLYQKVIFQKEQLIPVSEDNTITFNFTHEDTINIEPSNDYRWDITIYHNPVRDDNNVIIGGASVDSYYAAFKLPVCQIRVAP